MEFTIRPLEESDLPALRELTDTSGWNHSEEYLNFSRETNPQGYLVAVDKHGKLLSHCGATFLTKDIGFIGFYITQPELRGKGISKQVFDACMAHLGDVNVGLNAISHKTDMYRSGGFTCKSFTLLGFIGYPKHGVINNIFEDKEVTICPLSASLEPKVLEYDASIHPVPRETLMKKWFDRPGMKTLVAAKDDAIIGYVCIMPAVEGYRVSPLYADSLVIARMLWKAAISETGESKIEVVALGDDADKLFTESLTLSTDIFKNVRLFTKEIVNIPKTDAVYSICNYDTCVV